MQMNLSTLRRVLLEDRLVAHELSLFMLVLAALATRSAALVGTLAAGVALALAARTRNARRSDEVAGDLARGLAVAHWTGSPPAAAFDVVQRLTRAPGADAATPDALPAPLAREVEEHAPWLQRLLADWASPGLPERLCALARWIREAGAARDVLGERARSRGAVRAVWCTIGVAGFLVSFLLVARAAPGTPINDAERAVVLMWAAALCAQLAMLARLRTPGDEERRLLEYVLFPAGQVAGGGEHRTLDEAVLAAVEIYRTRCLTAGENLRVAATLANAAPVLLAILHPMLAVGGAVTSVAAALR